jgi:hypothetical protein
MEKQVNLMRDQLKVAEGSLAETKRVNTGTEQSIKESAEHNKKILKINQKLADYAGKQAAAANRSADASQASARAAEKSAQTAQASLVTVQRPWVLVRAAEASELKAGYRARAHVIITNFGNTPAFNVIAKTNISFRDSLLPTPMPMGFPISELSVVTIGPRGDYEIFPEHSVVLTETLIKEIPRKNLKLYIWGRIEYDDIFQKHHITDFCMVQKMGTDKFDACSSNNTAN